MEADGRQALGFRVEVPGDGVGGGDVARVGVWVAEEVGEGDGAEAVVVGVVAAVEFNHLLIPRRVEKMFLAHHRRRNCNGEMLILKWRKSVKWIAIGTPDEARVIRVDDDAEKGGTTSESGKAPAGSEAHTGQSWRGAARHYWLKYVQEQVATRKVSLTAFLLPKQAEAV